MFTQIFDTIVFLLITVVGFCFTWLFVALAIQYKTKPFIYTANCIVLSAFVMACGIAGLLYTWKLL